MTKTDVLNGLAAKPVPFVTPAGFSVLLRPLRFGERSAVFGWFRGAADLPDRGEQLTRKLVALAVCDEGGYAVLTEADVDGLDPQEADAIAKEVSRRTGIAGDADPGKAQPPETPN